MVKSSWRIFTGISPSVIHSTELAGKKRTIWKHLKCFIIFQSRVWKKNLQLLTLAVRFTESPNYREVLNHGFRLRQGGNFIMPVLLWGMDSKIKDLSFSWSQTMENFTHTKPPFANATLVIGHLITLFAHIYKGCACKKSEPTLKTLPPSNETTCFCQQLNWLESCLFLLVLVHTYFHWSLMSIELKA